MFGREIKFTDFDDNEVTEKHWFNLNKSELVELEVKYKGGFGNLMQSLIDENDSHELIKRFKEIVLLTYGKREGTRFIKNDQLREEFTQTQAYDALFIELATNAEAAAEFIRNVLPKSMRADFDKAQKEDLKAVESAPAEPAPAETT